MAYSSTDPSGHYPAIVQLEDCRWAIRIAGRKSYGPSILNIFNMIAIELADMAT